MEICLFTPFRSGRDEDGVAVDDGALITIGTLCHSSIVRQLLANVPLRVVAALHDTSVAMIERDLFPVCRGSYGRDCASGDAYRQLTQ